jgi:sensor histidine kinase YesM
MKLRLTSKVELDVQFPENYSDTMISPLLFLPFIENAFKYGVSNRTPSFIQISLKINGDELNFECHNSFTGTPDQLNASHQGIGLDNVRKRLNLLYPGKHDLTIYINETAFHVILSLTLSNTPSV